ncbi:MAG: hypothetical protein SPH68_03450 [Candidatus Borkfalkiaceae bacterium]|nr:hypothetical protein [Clostridia bacterium]MDY6223201.1 hypothetical protein [Christensenellaceae bacterium]
MLKKTKTVTMLVAAAAAVFSAGVTRLFLQRGKAEKACTVQAEEQAEEGVTETEFAMKEGASVRLNVEEEMYGIRFGATVVDTEREYAMMIVPKELLAGYEEKKTEGEKRTEYCERIAEAAGGSVAKAEGLTANEQGEIACALVEIKWENLNRSFVGLAYYEENGERIEAALAQDGERSVSAVAKNALESGELTQAQQTAALRLQTDGEKEARGVAVDAALGEELFGLTDKENADGELLYESPKRVDVGAGEISAEGWKLYGKEVIDTQINKNVWKQRLRYENGTASFVMWCGQTAKAEFMNAEEKLREIAFLADEAKLITLPTEELTSFTRLRIKASETNEEGRSEYFIGEITEKTAEAAAREVSEAIAALPSEEKLKNAEDTVFETYRKQIEAASRLYEGLSEFGKTLVAGTELLETLAATAEERQTKLFDWTNASGLITKENDESNVYVNESTDEDYGNGWQITRRLETESDEGTYIRTKVKVNTIGLEEQTSAYAKIVFYVYAEHTPTADEELKLTIKKQSPNGEKTEIPVALENGAWVKITLEREAFLQCTHFTAFFDAGETGLKISAFYGVK